MKRFLLIALVAMLATSVFYGCSFMGGGNASAASTASNEAVQAPEDADAAKAADLKEETVQEEAESVPLVTDEAAAGEAPAGEAVSAQSTEVSITTGLPDTTAYKPVFVQIDNATNARPQPGLQSADVVYETSIETDDLDTRLSAIFNDVIYKADSPERLVTGPVRSSRYYHQWIQSEWDALYVHMGGPDATANPESDIWGESDDHVKQRINGAGKHTENADMFFKNDKGDSIEAFAMTDVIADAQLYNYEPNARKHFNFSQDDVYMDMPKISGVKLSFSSNPGWVEYRYDEGTDKLTRYMSDNVFTDYTTGEPVTVQNVIIQYVPTGDMPNDVPHRKVDLLGEGPAEFYIHGRHVNGTWERAAYGDITTFKTEDGQEVTITPGNTWIEIHPNNKTVVTTYTDGTESVTNPKD